MLSPQIALNQSIITKIVAQASYLSERCNLDYCQVNHDQTSEQQVEDMLEHWCQVVAGGNWDRLQKRLQWDGLNLETVRPLLGEVSFVNNVDLPNWAKTLTLLIETTAELFSRDKVIVSFQITSDKSCLDSESPLPFEDLFIPAMVVAQRKLLIRLNSKSLSDDLPLKLMSKKAYLKLERSLLNKLSSLCAKTLDFEFSHFRPIGQSLLTLLIGDAKDEYSRFYYNKFIQHLLQDSLLNFFQKYPVLARLIATTIDFWVEATVEFLERLNTDLPVISQIFQPQKRFEDERKVINQFLVDKVAEIQSSLSDFHNQGRSVNIITFDSGIKIVYKPRNLGLEAAYGQLLNWCNQNNIPLAFKVLKMIDRRTYGWVEYVEQQPCEDEVAAQRFYQRAGMLLCLLYALGGTDCHYENVIANGEHLVLVDIETLMHHKANFIAGSSEAIEAEIVSENNPLWNSVLTTGLLPNWQFNKDNSIAYDSSGLGGITPQECPLRIRRWKSINTDEMHFAYETVMMPSRKNVPILNQVPLSPDDYIEEIVSGFEQMYRFLIKQREILLEKNSPLKAFQAQQVRFVFRDTKVYGIVLRNSLAPEFLKSGLLRSIELDILSQSFLIAQEKPHAWPILQAELKAMEQLDIPLFGANANSDVITVGLESPIKNFLKEPSYNQVLTRLQQFSETDLAQQVAIIKGTFYAKVVRNPANEQRTEVSISTYKSVNYSQLSPLTGEQLVQEAELIAEEIQRAAIRSATGGINWINLSYLPSAERFQFMLLDSGFYNGNGGIALFLGALSSVTGNSQFHHLALAALQPLCQFLQNSDVDFSQIWARHVGIGGATGLGSILYPLLKTSQLLSNTDLLEDAQRIANLITPELIASDRQFDVISGTAGAILGLLALYQSTGEATVLEKAVLCGQHLLQHRISINDGPRAWKNFAQKPLTGFSHGSAGIAYSLLRLYAITQDRDYLEAAEEGIAYERSVFSKADANWPDFRSSDQPNDSLKFMANWCHGAPGVGLARLGSLSILDTDEIRQEIEVALQTTNKYSIQGIDHLCCGNFGRNEVLLVASQKLSRPALQETAQKQAAWVVARAKQKGAYHLFMNLPNQVFNPSLFQGTAGIGYQLLRLAYPEKLPSLLLWE